MFVSSLRAFQCAVVKLDKEVKQEALTVHLVFCLHYSLAFFAGASCIHIFLIMVSIIALHYNKVGGTQLV